MTHPDWFREFYLPTKSMLSSYRALLDGQQGIHHLERLMAKETSTFLSEWRLAWVGAFVTLRASVFLIEEDSQSCINKRLGAALRSEWHAIAADKEGNAIFWEFLKSERDSIAHQYRWSAYEMWLRDDGSLEKPRVSLLSMRPEEAKSVMVMGPGRFEGQNAIDLLQNAASWIEDRLFSAIRRAGFDPDEERSTRTFKTREESPASASQRSLIPPPPTVFDD